MVNPLRVGEPEIENGYGIRDEAKAHGAKYQPGRVGEFIKHNSCVISAPNEEQGRKVVKALKKRAMSQDLCAQADRAVGCQEERALCADASSPCHNCFLDNPFATVCENSENYIIWGSLHFTSAVHKVAADVTGQCTKDSPNYDHAWVGLLCPQGA